MKKILKYFSIFEWCLWLGSIVTVVVFFIVLQNKEWLYLVTTILGATSLIFLAKGNLIGLILTSIFSVFYTKFLNLKTSKFILYNRIFYY